MKSQFTLEINKPCSEKFSDFTKTNAGGFCNSCQKEVVDFTGMSSQEIINYFKNHTNEKTCGQFADYQLATYSENSNPKKYSFLRGIGLACLSLFTFNTVQAQQTKSQVEIAPTKPQQKTASTQQKTFTVRGIVSEGSYPLPGAAVMLQGTTIGVETDFEGAFEFPKPLKKGDVLIVSFIGMDTQKITIKDPKSASNINLKVDLKSDSCVLLGEVTVKKPFKSKKKFWKK